MVVLAFRHRETYRHFIKEGSFNVLRAVKLAYGENEFIFASGRILKEWSGAAAIGIGGGFCQDFLFMKNSYADALCGLAGDYVQHMSGKLSHASKESILQAAEQAVMAQEVPGRNFRRFLQGLLDPSI